MGRGLNDQGLQLIEVCGIPRAYAAAGAGACGITGLDCGQRPVELLYELMQVALDLGI